LAEQTLLKALPDGLPVTVIRNKIDLSGRVAGPDKGPDGAEIALSLKTGDGFETLRDHLKEVSGYSGSEAGDFMARRRHLDALKRAGEAIGQARVALDEQAAGELVAEELRLAQQALGEITGAVTSDDLLGRIFAEFCIGK